MECATKSKTKFVWQKIKIRFRCENEKEQSKFWSEENEKMCIDKYKENIEHRFTKCDEIKESEKGFQNSDGRDLRWKYERET